jgi:hypothetical protein
MLYRCVEEFVTRLSFVLLHTFLGCKGAESALY